VAKRLRLMSDWGLYPFYVQQSDGETFDLTDADWVGDDLPLSAAAVSAVVTWDDELYQSVLNWDDPAATDFSHLDRNGYYERGREICRMLRAELPADVGIEFLDPADRRPNEYY